MDQPQAPQGGGGASQLAADAHSSMMKLLDLVQGKFPEEGKELSGIIQQFQGFVESLGAPPGASAEKGPAMPATTSPEAGAAQVKPAM